MIIKTQAEFDALPAMFGVYTTIEICSSDQSWIRVDRTFENSHVVAWGSSHVEAWGSSHVVAWGSSHVVARGEVYVHVKSELNVIELFGFAVAILLAKCKSLKRHVNTTTVVRLKRQPGTDGYLDREGIKTDKKSVVLFKKVSADFKTQENTSNETKWEIGTVITHKDWQPKNSECGARKFHACSRPYFCDEFRSLIGDRYVAVCIKLDDLFAWDKQPINYPHKIGFREGKVLYECDRYGKKI